MGLGKTVGVFKAPARFSYNGKGIECFFFLFNISSASTWCFFPIGTRTLDAHDPSTRTEPEHFTVPPKWVPFPTKVAYRLFEVKKIFDYKRCSRCFRLVSC
jgi:hypothetical protein